MRCGSSPVRLKLPPRGNRQETPRDMGTLHRCRNTATPDIYTVLGEYGRTPDIRSCDFLYLFPDYKATKNTIDACGICVWYRSIVAAFSSVTWNSLTHTAVWRVAFKGQQHSTLCTAAVEMLVNSSRAQFWFGNYCGVLITK